MRTSVMFRPIHTGLVTRVSRETAQPTCCYSRSRSDQVRVRQQAPWTTKSYSLIPDRHRSGPITNRWPSGSTAGEFSGPAHLTTELGLPAPRCRDEQALHSPACSDRGALARDWMPVEHSKWDQRSPGCTRSASVLSYNDAVLRSEIGTYTAYGPTALCYY